MAALVAPAASPVPGPEPPQTIGAKPPVLVRRAAHSQSSVGAHAGRLTRAQAVPLRSSVPVHASLQTQRRTRDLGSARDPRSGLDR
jgi:hypothetical protein